MIMIEMIPFLLLAKPLPRIYRYRKNTFLFVIKNITFPYWRPFLQYKDTVRESVPNAVFNNTSSDAFDNIFVHRCKQEQFIIMFITIIICFVLAF